MHNKLGEAILRHRTLAGLSQRELGRQVGISNAFVSQVERGLHRPSSKVMIRLAGALGVSMEQLAEYREQDVQGSGSHSTEQAILEDQLLGPIEQQSLIAVYRSLVALGSG